MKAHEKRTAECAPRSAMSMFLTRDEMTEQTSRQKKAKVAEWYTLNGYRFDLGADGWPRVLRAAVEGRLLPAASKRTIAKTEPDFSAYGTPKKAA